MKLTKIILASLAIFGIASTAQARCHRHGPRVSFGISVARPMYYPVYAPCKHGFCRPIVVARPVVYAPYVRPSFGVSFGSGPVSFGFGF